MHQVMDNLTNRIVGGFSTKDECRLYADRLGMQWGHFALGRGRRFTVQCCRCFSKKGRLLWSTAPKE